MFLHRKTKDLDEDQDPCKNYQVLCGIEEEFLIINKEGTLVNAADELMVRAAEILERDSKRLDFLQLKIRLNKSRTITDQRGRKYGVSRGTQVQGKLSVDYKLTYQEEDNIVTNFQGIRITNTLDVQGIKIPLDNKDRILVALSRSDYLSRSLFGGFRF